MAKKGKKNAAAQALVALRHEKLTPERRKEIATKAAKARWGKAKKAGKKK